MFNTKILSPKAQLRLMFPLESGASRPHRGDWCKLGDGTIARTGLYVVDAGDERHVGRIEAIKNSSIATVRWIETRWLSEIKLSRLRLADPETYK